MSFVRPKTLSASDEGTDLFTAIGGADERDWRSVEQLGRAMRLMAIAWPLILAARVLLVCQTIGWSELGGLVAEPLFVNLGIALCLVDMGIFLSCFVTPIRQLSPNRHLLLALPFVFVSNALFTAMAAAVFAGDMFDLMLVALTPAMLAIALFGRQRPLALAYGLGGLTALASHVPFFALLAALLIFTAGVVAMIAVELRLIRRARANVRETQLTGDQAKALLADFEQSGRGWFWETDRAGNVVYLSGRLAAQLQREPQDLVGKPFSALIAPARSDMENEGQRTLGFHFSARTSFSDIAVQAAGAEGERWWSLSGQPVMTPFGQFLGFRGNGSDLTEMRRSQAEIARLARFDSLTGLANRMQMLVTLEQALIAQRGTPVECALFLIDLDRFKEVNDTMGHPAGDALLRQVAQRLLRIVGTQGKVGRLGGDEFKIVFPGVSDRGDLTKLAEGIIHALSQPYSIDASQIVIGASIGIALAPTDGTSTETLIRNADLALYAAKADGRGIFRYYAPAMHADAEDRRQLEQDLRHAISTGGLYLEYQPVVCASTERITGFEALIRWRHPERAPISPALFIPIAEEAGLIGAIGEWVLRTACSDAVKWPDGIRVAVNVSPIQFANPSLPAFVMSALANAGLSASRLELEITEGVFLANNDDSDGMFAALKGLGVRLALDDFGTGYSALGYLKTAPFDKIKIDQSFVRGAAIKGSRNAAIVKSIVNLAEALGMETTAEGAETLDELALIRSLGCSHIQGYVYGQPATAEETQMLLVDGNGHASPAGHKASREPRMTMLRSVVLRHDGNDYVARIRNISRDGGMIEGVQDVPPDTTFQIELFRDLVVNGRCRWSQGDRMGVEFDRPIDLDQLPSTTDEARDRKRAREAAAGVPDFYRGDWQQAG